MIDHSLDDSKMSNLFIKPTLISSHHVHVALIDYFLVAGSFVVNFLVLGGCIKSFSVLYHEFRNAYDATYSATGWIVSISGCLMLLLGGW